jgi:hypothetical protein
MTTSEHRSGDGGRLRRRYWVELALASVATVLFVLTLLWHDWIEAFGVEPDGGDGSLEWIIVAVFAVVALVSAALARAERRRWRSAQTQAG